MDVHPSISTVRQIQDEAHVDGVNGEDPGSDDTKTVGLALGFVNEPTTEFYGESSSIMFTRRLLEAMSLDLAAKRTKTKSPCNGTGSVECNIAPVSQQRSVMASPKNQPSSPATFVSETEMDSLLDIHFNDYGSLVTWGRPPAIPDEYIMVKLPSPWVTMTETITNLSNDGDIHTAFFDATVRLLQVVGLSLATQYGQNLGPGDQKIDKSTAIQAASTMRQDIQRWASSLPSCLGLYDTGPDVRLQNENTCLKADAAEYRRPVAEHDNLSNGCVADTGSEELTYKQLWSTVGLPSLPDPDIGPTSHGRVIRSILWRIELDRRPAKLHLLSHCLQV
ncbi:C6 transcription factor [Aspergillus luchuensis]|uniref:C6 transcription factor n=1 Tax=Aspergillus kawachii TaxID=1069201 RepID=A0A146EYD4_ASPKA|nr:C6 transcription factor [Aspergillus luchuensis]